MPITHKLVSAKPDSADPTKVSSSEWNDAHKGNGLDWFNVKDYGADPTGVASSNVAIQAAMDAALAAGGGQVVFPPGTFKLASSLVLRKGVSIQGVYPGVTPVSAGSWDLGFTVSSGTILTYPGGTVFTQDMSAGLGVLPVVDGVAIESLGFDSVGSIMVTGATNKSGLCGSTIRNVLASNVTGLAFDMTNPMHLNMSNVKVANAYQFLRVTSDYDSAVINNQPGNSYFTDLYAYITSAGHGQPSVQIRVLNPNSNGTNLNYLSFYRLQVNRFASTSKTGAHLSLEGVSNAAITNCSFEGLDLEGYADKRINILNAVQVRVLFAGDANGSYATTDFYLRSARLANITCMDPTVTLDMDATCVPVMWNGAMKSFVGSYVPMGLWYDNTLNAQRLGMGDWYGTQTLINNTTGTWQMPIAFLDFNGSGGDVRQRVMAGRTDDTFVATIDVLGYAEMTKAGTQAVTLPDATTCKGQRQTIKKTGASGTVTIGPAVGGQTIDGAATNTWLDTQYKYITLQSNGTNWLIVAKG